MHGRTNADFMLPSAFSSDCCFSLFQIGNDVSPKGSSLYQEFGSRLSTTAELYTS